MKTDKTIFVQGKERKIWINNGYEKFSLKGKPIKLHRYLWEEAFGKIPDGCHIHHKDENKLNNSLDNLECISCIEHAKLHKIGNTYKGGYIYWHKKNNKWIARAFINTKLKHLGCFHTKLEAYEALFKHDPEFWTKERQEEITKDILAKGEK